MSEPIHIISLGAGVQSSTMSLMAAAGEITPMPVAAIFADTQAEPASVYRWLDWLEKQLPFPVHRVTRGNLAETVLRSHVAKDGRLYTKTGLPFFTLLNGEIGKVVHRDCTNDFKIAPIRKKVRELAGIKNGQKRVAVIQWIGISLDEVSRMKDARDPWQENRWPLVECRMSRHDCIEWMLAKNYPKPPRSACVFCPFHNDGEWRRLKTEEGEEFEKAVQFEKAATHNFKAVPFLHRSCKPLSEVDFSTEEERGQLNMFNNECSGMCGV